MAAKGVFRKQAVGAMVAALGLVAAPVSAFQSVPAEAMFDGQWHFSVTPYAWLPTIYTSATFGPMQINTHETVMDYWSHLSFAFFIAAEARKGDWSAFADYNYVKFSGANSGLKPIDRPGLPRALPYDSSTDLKSNILTLAGAYTVLRQGASHLDVVAGARYLNMDLNFNYSVFPVPAEVDFSRRLNKWDGIVGIKGQIDLSDDRRWFMPYYADIGSGSNNWTWMAMLGTGYRFDLCDVTLGVRSLSYKFDGRLGVDLRQTGFALGADFKF